MITRRGILGSLLAAPIIIRTPALLMPIRPVPAAMGGIMTPDWLTEELGRITRKAMLPRLHTQVFRLVGAQGLIWEQTIDASVPCNPTTWGPA